MTKTKILSVVSYLTWVGWVIALLFRDKDDGVTLQHVNQSLVINLVETAGTLVSRIALLAWLGRILAIAALIFNLWGIWRAIQGSAEPLPYVGDIRLIN